VRSSSPPAHTPTCPSPLLFATEHGIPTVHDSYEALVGDPDIDAVYNALPNGLHGRWTTAALRAGKHVLCEKPFTANADEAAAVAAVADETGLVAMEAFHYRYHPFLTRALEVIGSSAADIRWDLSLAGGALMDVGCYPVHLLRTLAGTEPEVESASAGVRTADVDRWMRAELAFPGGRTGSVSASMLSRRPRGAGARVIGSHGWLELENPFGPHRGNGLVLHTRRGTQRERVPLEPSTYALQLQAFADAVLRGPAPLTGTTDAVANMRVIDACYAKAGLPRREPT
jgi:predicted dehydrogenase